jgi:hypothetical protein
MPTTVRRRQTTSPPTPPGTGGGGAANGNPFARDGFYVGGPQQGHPFEYGKAGRGINTYVKN